jgi:hypothetical protein
MDKQEAGMCKTSLKIISTTKNQAFYNYLSDKIVPFVKKGSALTDRYYYLLISPLLALRKRQLSV